MAKKQVTSRVEERLADDLAEFCRGMRAVQEGVIEAAIYWLVHRMPKEQYVELMQQATAYLDGEPTADEAAGRPSPAEELEGELGKSAPKRRKRARRTG